MNCHQCGHAIYRPSKSTEASFRRSGRAYCSTECSNAYRAKRSSETMAETNRKHASARMKTNNPMHRGDVKERMMATLNRIGHRPSVRGGNGSGLTVPQNKLRLELWYRNPVCELVIPTGAPRKNSEGLSTHYKIDIALEREKLAIEVDGESHAGKRKEQDAKKEKFLASRGWRTLRFTNQQILSSIDSCLASIEAAIPK